VTSTTRDARGGNGTSNTAYGKPDEEGDLARAGLGSALSSNPIERATKFVWDPCQLDIRT
jgi:hypothetical protein